jgi:hypothetical protein
VKGVVFNLLEEAVTRDFGAETWEALLDASSVDGAYTAVGSYPDEELVTIVSAASSSLGKPAGDLLRWFGRAAMPDLAARYPAFFESHRTTRSFLLTLNDIIHPEVRKLYPGAQAPDFEFDTSSAEVLDMRYRSHRQFCELAEGLIEGAADHFGELATITQPECMKHGSDSCLLRCSFASAAP